MNKKTESPSGRYLRITADERYILIREGGREIPYPVTTLQHIETNLNGLYSALIVSWAREALETFGKSVTKKEEEAVSLTITTIAGIKVYETMAPIRRFFARIRGVKVYSESLSEIEREIKGE